MQSIDLETAKTEGWDVILAGSSFAACFFAYSLKGRGLRVLFVERGPFADHGSQLDGRFDRSYPKVPQDNSSGQRKDWIVRHQFGGCSNCWWGNTPRLHQNDFRLQSLYGVAQDWPISYGVLESYMTQAEYLMDVTGTDGWPVGPRSRPYPFPPHKPTRAERLMTEANPSWQPMPSARSNGGRRANCCVSGTCGLCPIDAKFTILNALDLFEDPDFYYLTDAECRTVETSSGLATGITIRTSDGIQAELKANFVGLATNPIYNSAILLRSGLGGEKVGRGIHEQAGQFIWLDIPFDNYYGGTSLTGMGHGLYDGDFRREAASVLIESWNAPPSLRLERGKWLQRLKLKLVAEDLPQPENRVVLEDDEAKIIWTGHSDYAFAGLARGRELFGSLLPFEHELERFSDFEPTEAHLIGGTPMGDSPENGVVDKGCKVFGVPNLACLGSGSFTTGAAANPTLTLSALSLYAGEQL
ncbi:GMC oxidoreductase [Actibacterium sp. 188UL27-1]|uniref:GMC oxidoreductase n=1 Tax=Actibacterium sp. 188UL27-1 TaxID=2786961 RepID=UPI00195E22C7|nr:GMC family oxidoreductase [Actibacterium sp. 188UL27-1]MBM7069098.1 GMC family oxidoreductase [Actibacterium sp. 188UL27-1]